MECHHTLFDTAYPQYPDLDINKKYAIATQYNHLWQKKAGGYQSYAVPYSNELIFTSYNPFFMPIIRNDTGESFKRFYASMNSTFYAEMEQEVHEYNVIVVHLRLGDTLMVKSARRILLKMRYFSRAFDMIYGIRWNKECHIYVLAQLDLSNVHTQKDKDALIAGNKLAYFMMNEFKKYLDKSWSDKFKDRYKMRVIGNDTADDDIFRMATASYLIGSPSSFSLEAAMGNFMDTRMIIHPSKGPWRSISDNFNKITSEKEFYRVEHHHFIDVSKLSVQTYKFGNLTEERGFRKFKSWFLS